jgi:enamine deaminase RidA (YjgF/YER057c/UK114 family)
MNDQPANDRATIEARLKELGIELPTPPAVQFNYIPTRTGAGTLWVAGQVPFKDGQILVEGKLGGGVSLEDGQRAARQCALNVLAQAKAALDGDLSRIRATLKVTGWVACTPDFYEHPKVINAASDLFVEVLGEIGRHARCAIGSPSLPLNCAVEVDAVFLID